MAYIYDLTDTWSAAGTVFNGIKLNVTDTASAAASKLVTLQVGGTEHFSVTKAGVGYFSGNVGIGTSSPDIFGRSYTRTVGINSSGTTMLQINGTTYGGIDLGFNGTRTANILAETAGFYLQTVGAVPMVFTTNGTERARIDSSGNLLVGTTSVSGKFTVDNTGASTPVIYGKSGDQAGARIAIANTSGQTWHFVAGDVGVSNSGLSFYDATAAATRMRIDSSGNLLVGTTTTEAYLDGKLNVAGRSHNKFSNNADYNYVWNATTSGDAGFIHFGTEAGFTTRGTITYNRAGGVTVYATTSDYRAKTIHGDVGDVGEVIDAFKVYDGTMNGATQNRPMLIAHEAQAIAPYAVVGEKDAVNPDGTPAYQSIDTSVLIPLLIAEIQSLRARVAQLEGN